MPAKPESRVDDNEPPPDDPVRVRDLIWADTFSRVVNDTGRSLSVELGFFPVRLKGPEATEPIVCGCGCVRIETRFEGASLTEIPRLPVTPDETSAKVEFGAGARARVRFEAIPSRSIIDGRGSIEYTLTTGLSSVTAFPPSSRGSITIDPQWFAVDRPTAPPRVDRPPLDGAAKVLVNMTLQRLERERVPVEKSFLL